MTPAIRLIIFDLDGTLTPFDGDQLFPDAAQWITNNPQTQWIIATNQGGIGLRYWMERDGFGEPAKYPASQDFEARVKKLFPDKLPALVLCARYQSKKSGQWSPIPPGEDQDQKWRADWRKPAPGMLIEAMRIAHVAPAETLMVGDGDEDDMAAANAGCQFQWAWQFFGRPQPEQREMKAC